MRTRTEPKPEDGEHFLNEEDESDRQQRNLNNTNRRRPSTVSDESQWLDNIEHAYEDALSNIDPE